MLHQLAWLNRGGVELGKREGLGLRFPGQTPEFSSSPPIETQDDQLAKGVKIVGLIE